MHSTRPVPSTIASYSPSASAWVPSGSQSKFFFSSPPPSSSDYTEEIMRRRSRGVSKRTQLTMIAENDFFTGEANSNRHGLLSRARAGGLDEVVAQNGACRWPVSSAWRLYSLRRLLW
jgi:hypothetical protein